MCGGQRPTLGILHLICWDRVSHWDLGLIYSARLATEPIPDIPLPLPSQCRLQATTTKPRFLHSPGDGTQVLKLLWQTLYWLNISPSLMLDALCKTKMLCACHHCWGTLRDAEAQYDNKNESQCPLETLAKNKVDSLPVLVESCIYILSDCFHLFAS